MCRSNRRWTTWGLFLLSSAAAVLLLGLDSSSASAVEAAVLGGGPTASSGRGAVRKTAKAGRAQYRGDRRGLQSGKGGGGKGGQSGKGAHSGLGINNNAALPSGMLAAIDAIDSMHQGILQHQTNPKKSSKGSSSGGTYSDYINYADGESTPTTPTTDPAITGPILIYPNQGGSNEEFVSGGIDPGSNGAVSNVGTPAEVSSPMDTILDNSISTPSNPIDNVPSTGADQDSISTPSAPIDLSAGTAVGDSTEAPTSGSTNQQDAQQEKDKEHISTDEFVNLDDTEVNNSNPSDGVDGDNDIVIIMPTPSSDTTGLDDEYTENSSGLPDFQYGSTINNYSPNQLDQREKEDEKDEGKLGKGGKGGKEKEDALNTESIAVDSAIDEMSENYQKDVDEGKGKDKPTKGDTKNEAEVDLEVNVDPNADDESITPIQDPIVEPSSDEEEDQSINSFPNVDSEPSTPGNDEGSDLQADADGNDDQDTSPSTETASDQAQEAATDGTAITIPPLGQGQSEDSDTASEVSLPPNDKDLPENALSPIGNDEDESGGKGGGDFQRLDIPGGLVVSLFLSEEEARRLQGSPTDPLKNQEDFEFVLNGMGETEVTLQNYLSRHLNDYLIQGLSGLSFVSIDRISAFFTTKSYQGRPTPAIVVKSIEGTTTYQGVEKPSSRLLEANTLGAFNTDEGKTAFIDNLRDSGESILSRTIDVSAEINRGAISPSSDTASPIANAAKQNDTNLRANSGSAAKSSGIAIGGLIIIVTMFLVGHKLVHRSKDETELDDENWLEHKYDLDSIECETAFSSTLVSYHAGSSSMEESIPSHHREIIAYDDGASDPEGTLVLSPVVECPSAEDIIEDLIVPEKIQISAEEPQEQQKVPTPILRKIYCFSSSSLKRAVLGNGLQKEMTAASMMRSGRAAYDMSTISPSISGDTDETPQVHSPSSDSGRFMCYSLSASTTDECPHDPSPSSDSGKSALLLQDGLASRGPRPPAELNATVDASRAIMCYSLSESTDNEEDQVVPSTVDIDAVDSNEAAQRLGLGIRSFRDVKEEDGENRLVVKSIPKPVATPERKTHPSLVRASLDSEQQSVWRQQQKTQSTIPDVSHAHMTTNNNNTSVENGQETKLYDPIFVNGKVQMKERSPPYRLLFRK